MKTQHQVTVQHLAPGDFFDWASVTYKVVSVQPHPMDRDLTNVNVVDVDGEDNTFVLPTVAGVDVTRDDGLVGAPSHVVVDVIDGYVFSRDRHGDGFNLESAWAFAVERNAASKRPTYKVFALSAITFPPVDDQEV